MKRKRIFLKHECLVGAHRKRVTVKVGYPRRVKHAEWSCSIRFEGLGNGRRRMVYGVDGLQALTVASTLIRALLSRFKRIEAMDEPYEFVFPSTVPVSYGLEFHRRACAMLTKVIEKEEKRLTKKRLAARRRRKPLRK